MILLILSCFSKTTFGNVNSLLLILERHTSGSVKAILYCASTQKQAINFKKGVKTKELEICLSYKACGETWWSQWHATGFSAAWIEVLVKKDPKNTAKLLVQIILQKTVIVYHSKMTWSNAKTKAFKISVYGMRTAEHIINYIFMTVLKSTCPEEWNKQHT